jgi:hypothetical protein
MSPAVVTALRFIAAIVLAPGLTFLFAGVVTTDASYPVNAILQFFAFLLAGILAARIGGRLGWIAVAIGLSVTWVPIAIVILVSHSHPIANISAWVILLCVSFTTGLVWWLAKRQARGLKEVRGSSGV